MSTQRKLFIENGKGAHFSNCRKYRYCLWRIWDKTKPLVMFIGLNPSKADEDKDDNTIKKVCSIAKNNGYGGVYMTNCFPFVSTDPEQLVADKYSNYNENLLKKIAEICQDVVFAWGNFPVVKKLGVDVKLTNLFPNAKALHINKNGSPKHPLYCKIKSKLIAFKKA